VTAIAFAAIFFKKAAPLHPLSKSGLRLVIAAALLAPWTIRGWRRGALRGRLPWAALCGALYALHFGAWVWSLELTTVAASVTLVTATPLMLAVLGLITGRDRPSGRTWIGLALAAAGIALIGGADLSASPAALAGDGLALLGAAAMGVYLLVARRLGPELEVVPFMGVSTAVGGALLLGTAALTGVELTPPSLESLGWIVLAALVPQLIGHMALTWAVRHATPTQVGLSTLGEPVGSTLLGWMWLGEVASTQVLAGCALVLAALAFSLLLAPRAAST
jgi:drug/metabolite transporter (DMT)-like permease